ncbi:MAG: tetracycline resistance MFS efflux pump [Bacteroidia bacterium]|nr:MAG: tetracycline resistance MFS efflux pump [Bacteroidia bacterium]
MFSRLSVIFLTVFIDLLGFGIIIPILPNYALSIGANTLVTGIIAGVFSLMNFVMTSYLGQWSDKVGRRPVLIFTVLMNAVSYLLMAFASNVWLLMISRIIAGIGSANISVAQAYIADITAPHERTKKMALIGMAFGLGFILGPPIGGFLMNLDTQHGIKYVGLFTALLCMLNFIFVFVFLSESNLNLNANAPLSFKPIRNIKKYIALPELKNYLWYGFVFISAFSIFQVLSTIYWKEHCLLKDNQIGWLFGFVGIMSVFWQGVGLKWILKVMNEHTIIMIVSILMSVALLSLVFISSENVFPYTFIILFFISMGNGLISPSVTSLLSQRAPEGEGGALLGVFQSLNSLARTIAPVFGGFLYDIHFALPFVSAFIIMLISVFLIKRI